MARPDELIAALGLQPHPEGGWYAEVFRSASAVRPEDGRGSRAALTTIYFLLTAGQVSRLHRVSSDEVWHFYEGGPLELTVAPGDLASLSRTTLGPAADSAAPVFTVPAGFWQGARPLGDYTLVGCTVGPGFDFADFELLEADVRPITAAETRPLRQQVLRPLQRVEELVFECDAHPDAAHFGAFHRGRLIGISTIAPAPMPGSAAEAGDWQMRGMAVLPGAQGQGVGRSIIDACLAHLKSKAARRLWFNARVGAMPFYRRLGFEAVGDEFDVPTVGPHYVMTKALDV
jgi:predicted cupin superfamily sugar epimerase/predicted GNAT family N-acyltransferase